MPSRVTYVVKTDLPPEMVNAIGMIVFAHWLNFALGGEVLNGRRLIYPSGRYASAISYRQEGAATVAIIADEGAAPEAAVLEHGHGPIDLKTRLQRSRAYPMHRPVGGNAGSSLRRIGGGPSSMKPSMWAEIRMSEFSGFASIGPNSDPGSWVIPAMPAYSPAATLANMAKRMSQGLT